MYGATILSDAFEPMSATQPLYFGYGSNLNTPDVARWANERNVPQLTLEPLEPVTPRHIGL